MLFFLTLAALAFGLVGADAPGTPESPAPSPPSLVLQGPTDRTVVVAGEMPPEDLVALSSAVAAAEPPAVLLLDSPRTVEAHRSFLAAFRPDQVVAVGAFPDGIPDLERRLGVTVTPRLDSQHGLPRELRR